MSRLLVTGGAGFIGSHLCERLLRDGHDVICLDNFVTGHERNLATFQENPRFSLRRQDVTAGADLVVSGIYHLACPASPPHYQRDPIATTTTAVLGTLRMLELARRNACPILIASTSEVYGDPAIHPQPEEYVGHVNPIGPRACYDEGKRCAESLCFDFHRQHGVAIKVVRIFNTYGPRMDPHDGRVVSNFVVAAVQGRPLTIYGSGEQTRSFCYVDDLIEGLVRTMATSSDITGPINLGNPAEFTINQLAALVRQLTGTTAPITHHPLPTDDPTRRCPNITKARTLLHWEPTIPLTEGLQRLITHFRTTPDLLP